MIAAIGHYGISPFVNLIGAVNPIHKTTLAVINLQCNGEKMSHNKTPIPIILNILEQKFNDDLSLRKIANKLDIAPSTISGILKTFNESKLSWPLPEGMTLAQLESCLYPKRLLKKSKVTPQFEYIHEKLSQQGMSKHILWREYSELYKSRAYKFTQFCDRYNKWLQRQKRSLRQVHKGGDKLFVLIDSAFLIVNPSTGELRNVTIFFATLGASNYTYIEAIEYGDIAGLISAYSNAFNMFRGAARHIVTYQRISLAQNTHSFQQNYQSLAAHYGSSAELIKLNKNQSIRSVEFCVQLIYRWLLIKARFIELYTLSALQSFIHELCLVLNQKLIHPIKKSRQTRFKDLDSGSLLALPIKTYTFVDIKSAKSQINHHINYKGHFYSVPEQYIGEYLIVKVTKELVNVYTRSGDCVAKHRRCDKVNTYSTVAEHMPKNKTLYNWSPHSFRRWAKRVGTPTAKVIDILLHSKEFPEHSYKTCFAILNLEKKYGAERLNLACKNTDYLKVINAAEVEKMIHYELLKT